MRSLKIATTSSMVFGLLLLVLWPWIIGERPPAGPEHAQELKAYATKLMTYMTTVLLTFGATIFLSYRLVKVSQEQFRQQSMENLRRLIEGATEDHGRKES